MAKASPTAAELERFAVFMQYGRTMLSVQVFEGSLASLMLIASVRDPHRKTKTSCAQFQEMIERTVNAYTRTSARRAFEAIKDRVPEELLDDIDVAIKWRNRLAHRYLREQLYGLEGFTFRPGTLKQLERLARDFDRLGKRLLKENQRLTDGWPKDEPAPEIREFILRLGRTVLSAGQAKDETNWPQGPSKKKGQDRDEG